MKDFNSWLKALVAANCKLHQAHELLCDLALPDLAAQVRAMAEAVNREMADLVRTSARPVEVVS